MGDLGPILAAPTRHAPDLGLQVDAQAPAAQVADPTERAVVPAALHPPARPTGRFFDRRGRDRTRASGSPKIPRTVGLGRNPGEPYASQSRSGRRGVGTRVSCPISALPQERLQPRPARVPVLSVPRFHPHESPKTPFNLSSPAVAGRSCGSIGRCGARGSKTTNLSVELL